MKTISKKFESLTAFSAWLETSPVCGYFADLGFLASTIEDNKFSGTDSFNAANDLMLHGWQDGAARVAAYMAGGVRGSQDQAQNYYAPVGFAPSVGRYLTGHPCNMINRRKVTAPAPVVTICYNVAVGSNVKANSIEKTAATLFNVVSGLERVGVRVELWAGMFCAKGNEVANIAVKIKSAGQPFNLLKMVYPVVHPSFLRRHCFAFIERAGVSDSGWGSYGRPLAERAETEKAAAACGIKTKNIFCYYDLVGKSEKEIKDMIK